MKHSTQNYYLIAVRTFFKFLRERGIDSIDSEHIQLAKVSQPSPDIISVSERMRLMRAPDTKTLEGKRDKAILELLVSTGMRISELTALSVDDVDVTSDTFCLPVTGNNTRLVLLSDTAKKCLKKYLANRTDFDNALFIRYGRKANDGGELRISSRAVQRLLKKYATQSGIAKKVTPHVLRHSFATEQLQKGADLQYVQGLLGHVSIASTQVYAPIANKPASDTSQQNK
jgi:site-specific recombinase XerD